MLKPNQGIVLVRQQEPETVSAGGIVLVQSQEDSDSSVRKGVVVAVGDDCSVNVGEVVLFPESVGQETKADGIPLLAVLDEDILGVEE